MTGPPFDKHPTSAATIRAAAGAMSAAEGHLDAVDRALQGPAYQAADAVDGELDGQIRGPTDQARADAVNGSRGARVCKEAVRLFADYVDVFDRAIERLNERWRHAVARDFSVGEDVPDRNAKIATARGAEAAALRLEFGKLERALDDGAENVGRALSWPLNVAETELASLSRAVAPLVSNARVDGPELVALGDSYSAGTGTDNYYTTGRSDNPFRSTQAYSWLLAEKHGLRVNHQATNGDHIDDVLADQVSALSHDTEFVTLTAGGNDIGFSSVVSAAAIGDGSDEIQAAREQIRSEEFRAELSNLYREVRERAPNATIAVGTYPQFFDGEYGLRENLVGEITREEERAMNAAAQELSSVIGEEAAKYDIQVADVRERYEGHGTEESADQRWVNGIVLRAGDGEQNYGFVDADSYHPNAEGHRQYAEEFGKYIRD